MSDKPAFDIDDKVTIDIPVEHARWWSAGAMKALNYQTGRITERGMAWNRRGVNDRDHRRVVCVQLDKPVPHWAESNPNITVSCFWMEECEVHATTFAERHPGNFIKCGSEYRTIG